MKEMATEYTLGGYRGIRSHRKASVTQALEPRANFTKATTRRTDWILVQLMRDARLRAPHKPLGCDSVQEMYRGLSLSRSVYNGALKKGYLDDSSFTSFSTSFAVAESFTMNDDDSEYHEPVVLVLKMADVPAGTPWLWFGHACGRKRTASNKNRLRARFEHEQEVLLPPGRYRILETEGSDTWYVAFEPDTAATSIAYSSTDPMRRTRRIYPRSYRPAAPANKNAVNGYVPLHALFEGDNRSRTPKRPRNG